MSLILILEQVLNGLQFGVMLFLMAAGLTLVFGVMGLINLAHGSLYMIGAFAAAATAAATGSFLMALAASLAAAAITGVLVEALVIRRLYGRDHLDQVLATFSEQVRVQGVEVSKEFVTTPPPLLVDVMEIEQIFNNLL